MPRFLFRLAVFFAICSCFSGASSVYAASPQAGGSTSVSVSGLQGMAEVTSPARPSAVEEDFENKRKNIARAIKAATLPAVGILPQKQSWILSDFIEDPAWLNPEIVQAYYAFNSAGDFKGLYRPILLEAVQGNPRAMLLLAAAYERWGVGISGSFSVLHPAMHHAEYWQKWALQLTSPAWVEMRFGDLAPDLENKKEHYRKAAIYSDPEAVYELSLLENDPELLLEAALLWQPAAAAQVAFNLSGAISGFPFAPREAPLYWWLGAIGEDAQALLQCSEMFYRGQGGFPKDERRAYIFALLAAEKVSAYEAAQASVHMAALDANSDALSTHIAGNNPSGTAPGDAGRLSSDSAAGNTPSNAPVNASADTTDNSSANARGGLAANQSAYVVGQAAAISVSGRADMHPAHGQNFIGFAAGQAFFNPAFVSDLWGSATMQITPDLAATIKRHLETLSLAMNLNADELWQLQQELEVFKAALQELRLSRFDALAPQRASVVAALHDELFAVCAVLESSSDDMTEQQILQKLEQVRAEGDMEQSQRDMLLFNAERQHYNVLFMWFAAGTVLLTMLLYAACRLGFYSLLMRLVSHKSGGRA